MVPDRIIDGEGLHSLVTAMFLHGGIIHILGNMLFLLVFGDNVEDWMGHIPYAVFYFVAGFAASFAQIAADTSSIVPGVGASGAIGGVLGAYLVFHPRGSVRVFLFLGIFNLLIRPLFRLPAIVFLGIWFAMQLATGVLSLGAETAQTGGVAIWAHVGGFVAGVALAIPFRLLVARPKGAAKIPLRR